MNMMDSTKKQKISAKKEPLKPIANITSITKTQMYIRPTSFVTNMPKRKQSSLIHGLIIRIQSQDSPVSCVAGPGLVHGKKPGHKYAYSCSFLPIIPNPGTASNGACVACGAPCTDP